MLAANCRLSGGEAGDVVAMMGLKKIQSLARTSPEYQRHVIGRWRAGDTKPGRMIAATLLIYDTVNFNEVTSRLHRALGSVLKECRFLQRCLDDSSTPRQLAERFVKLDLIAENGHRLGELLNVVAVTNPHESNKSTHPKTTTSTNATIPEEDRLYTGGALGLIAKNVRNVACLQTSHRPTISQKKQALELTKRLTGAAEGILAQLRGRYRGVDRAIRVCGRSKPEIRIITHSKPDGDAIVSAWLAERHLFAGGAVEVLFVDCRRTLEAYAPGDCLVDVGNTYDPKNLFFDHKPPALPHRDDSCATKLLWDHLRSIGHSVSHLRSLVNAVFARDCKKARKNFVDELARSELFGFHAELDRIKKLALPDADTYRAARKWLDRRFLAR